jgi:steroid delta-isomerase-like uncharacterized protein
MTSVESLVGDFYEAVWNGCDEARAREILSHDVSFRGSLGEERTGAEGFIAYMRQVHAALADYRCTVEDLIASQSRATARVRFEGIHRGELLGFAATGRRITWTGAAFFTAREDRLADIWVLGDLESLRRQLAG